MVLYLQMTIRIDMRFEKSKFHSRGIHILKLVLVPLISAVNYFPSARKMLFLFIIADELAWKITPYAKHGAKAKWHYTMLLLLDERRTGSKGRR